MNNVFKAIGKILCSRRICANKIDFLIEAMLEHLFFRAPVV